MSSSRPRAEPVPRRRGRRRLLTLLVAAAAMFGWGTAAAVLAFGADDDAAVSIAQVRPVAGEPVYFQCSDRARSVLSKPGRVRGGLPRGTLRPGERFVVTSRTAYWRFGRVSDDPGRQGWVLAQYLCRAGG